MARGVIDVGKEKNKTKKPILMMKLIVTECCGDE